jgi:GTP-binding protein EngB required for normal cell division
LLIFTKADKLSESEKQRNATHALCGIHSLNPSSLHFLHYSIKDNRARIELIQNINGLLKEHGPH